MGDGAIAAFTAQKQHPQSKLAWGKAENQFVLPHPPIAMSTLDRHILCCLRAGTVYFLPVCGGTEAETVVFPFFEDKCDVPFATFVQNFTGGYINTQSHDGNQLERTVIFVHSWPGGILDVYSINHYDLNSSKSRRSLSQIPIKTVNRDFIHMVQCISNDNPLLDQKLWKDAWTESQNVKLELEMTAENFPKIHNLMHAIAFGLI
eukprot:CAMPEP_0118674146 /NCGR_PEP_ID=MMETSP0800-20121206/723_1 /TAXON_ID=210618 ORGANISM="Striatella unipunctata, Strain CCMP2910" /NCGR_SAMPLE_ID=MMETSP0800 /ASSEMBLY_ACC=CAM_ASM_000638 /LENGTH=204 /DNA_ID=CAMNT_0006569303 /DNA_START=212 /DNA_END=826 /DNA_ORIENTATION=+